MLKLFRAVLVVELLYIFVLFYFTFKCCFTTKHASESLSFFFSHQPVLRCFALSATELSALGRIVNLL